MDVYVDMSVCDSHGQCCLACPEAFQLDDDDYLQYDAHPPEELRAKVLEAQRVCPVQAIHLDADARARAT